MFIVWLSAFISVLVISVIGLLGVCLVPLLQKEFFNELLSFLVALAVGTLCGDSFLHLLPHVSYISILVSWIYKIKNDLFCSSFCNKLL